MSGKLDTANLRNQLERWYQQRAGLVDVEIASIEAPPSGMVNETWIHTVSHDRAGQRTSFPAVVRIQPVTTETPIPNVNVLEQAFVLRQLSKVEGLFIPKVFWEEPDAAWLGRPFFIMQQMPGEPSFDMNALPDDAAALRSMYVQMIALLTRIHAVDWERAGLEKQYCGTADKTPLQVRLEEYRAHLDAASQDKKYPLLEQALEWLFENKPRESAPVLNWGDARPGNLLFDGEELTAVLDWEIADITTREVDLGWFTFFERFLRNNSEKERSGAPTDDEIVSLYEEFAGTRLDDLDYFQRWAAFRLAVMRLRAERYAIKQGVQPAESRADEVNYGSIELARIFGFPEPT